MNRIIWTIAAAVLGASVSSVVMAEPSLKVGDAAPALASGKWVKGEPINALEPGKIYVVEFWATWCGPCREAISHVTQIQNELAKDSVIVIGQNVWEEDDALVEPFVKEMGEKMGYRVVMDDKSDSGKGKMAETWLAAAGRNGIPCTFIIDRAGKIAWIGHPMTMDPVLNQIVAGTFDPSKAASEEAAKERLNQQLGEALSNGEFDRALKLMDDYESQHPDSAGPLAFTRFQILLEKKEYDSAYKAAARVIDAAQDNAAVLNEIAWAIVDTPGLEKRDLDLAMKAGMRANELTHGDDAPILDTLARIHFEKGNIDKAIELERDALAKATPEFKAQMLEALDKYQSARKSGVR